MLLQNETGGIAAQLDGHRDTGARAASTGDNAFLNVHSATEFRLPGPQVQTDEILGDSSSSFSPLVATNPVSILPHFQSDAPRTAGLSEDPVKGDALAAGHKSGRHAALSNAALANAPLPGISPPQRHTAAVGQVAALHGTPSASSRPGAWPYHPGVAAPASAGSGGSVATMPVAGTWPDGGPTGLSRPVADADTGAVRNRAPAGPIGVFAAPPGSESADTIARLSRTVGPLEAAVPASASAVPSEFAPHAKLQSSTLEHPGLADRAEFGPGQDARSQDTFQPATQRPPGAPPPMLGQGQAIAAQIASVAGRLAEGSVEITLSPEELGRVRMTLSGSEGAMTVTVQVERAETLDLMRRHIDTLAQELRDMGFGTLDFAFGRQDPDTSEGDPPSTDPDPDSPRPETVSPAMPAGNGLDLRI
jgi:hypothetical protein